MVKMKNPIVYGLWAIIFCSLLLVASSGEPAANLLLFDYEHVNVLNSPRVMGPRHTRKNQTVFCTNISAETNQYLFGGKLSIKEKQETFARVKYEIFIADKDGSNQKRLTRSQEGVLSFAPRFTKDGKAIVYKEIYRTEDYADRFPDEIFTSISSGLNLFHTSEYAVVSGPFTINYFRLTLPDGPRERMTVPEAEAFYSKKRWWQR